jgi:hypothetical protein
MRRSVFRERHRKLRRGVIGEAAVWRSDIALDPPDFNRALRIGQVHDPAFVETLIAEPAIEALDIQFSTGFPGAMNCTAIPRSSAH